MSEIKRFSVGNIDVGDGQRIGPVVRESEDGRWVEYSDHAAANELLRAEVERLKAGKVLELAHIAKVCGDALGTDPALATAKGCAEALAGWCNSMRRDLSDARATLARTEARMEALTLADTELESAGRDYLASGDLRAYFNRTTHIHKRIKDALAAAINDKEPS